jgi:hypothetical protein
MDQRLQDEIVAKGRRGMTLVYAVGGACVFGAYSTFVDGRLPLLKWATDHRVALGLVWLLLLAPWFLVAARSVQQAIAAHALGVFAPGYVIAVAFHQALHSYLLAIAVTAWFSSGRSLPVPFFEVDGGLFVGVALFAVAFAVASIGNRIWGRRAELAMAAFPQKHGVQRVD